MAACENRESLFLEDLSVYQYYINTVRYHVQMLDNDNDTIYLSASVAWGLEYSRVL